MTYTQLAVLGLGAVVLVDLVVLRTRILARKVFWVSYAIIVFFQLVTNGVLTGYSIVQYSADDIVGSDRVRFLGDGRIAFAPFEDLLFGFAVVVLTLSLWVFWGRRGVEYEPQAGPPKWRSDESAES